MLINKIHKKYNKKIHQTIIVFSHQTLQCKKQYKQTILTLTPNNNKTPKCNNNFGMTVTKTTTNSKFNQTKTYSKS